MVMLNSLRGSHGNRIVISGYSNAIRFAASLGRRCWLFYRLCELGNREATATPQRKEHIASWRKELLPLVPPNTGWHGELAFQAMASPAFASLEPHLSPELLTKMRDEHTVRIGGDFPRRDLITEIGRFEKRWGLV